MPARVASRDGCFFLLRAKSNQETHRQLEDGVRGYGARSRASRGPSLRAPSPVHGRWVAAGLARPAGPWRRRRRRRRVGLGLGSEWSCGAGKLARARPFSSGCFCAGQGAVKTREGWSGVGGWGVEFLSSPPSRLSYASLRFCSRPFSSCTEKQQGLKAKVPSSRVP